MTRLLQLGAVALGGVIASVFIGFGSAYALGGAGHGWCSSVGSFLAVLFVPVLCIGFIEHERKRLRCIAGYVVSACLVTDGVLVVSTCVKGWAAITRVWEAGPGFLVSWGLLWLLLHIAVAALWSGGMLPANKALHAPAAAPGG